MLVQSIARMPLIDHLPHEPPYSSRAFGRARALWKRHDTSSTLLYRVFPVLMLVW